MRDDDQAKRSPIVSYLQSTRTPVGSRKKTSNSHAGSRFFIFGWLVGWVDLCRSTLEFMSRQQQEGCISVPSLQAKIEYH